MADTITDCRYCEKQHARDFLCGPARRVLDALLERGQRFDMPTVEFPEAISYADAFGPDAVLVAGVVVKAGIAEVAGMPQPVLIFTGNDVDGKTLPQWVYCASPPDMKRVMKLVTDMGTMAIRRARGAA
jgi:hypothetical protein